MIIRVLIIFLTFSIFTIKPISAEDKILLIKSINADSESYNAFLLSHDNYISPTIFSINNPTNKGNDQLLQLKYQKAQQAYFENNSPDAIKLYQDVISLALDDNWNLIQRRIIFLSFLKVIELNTNENLKRKIFQQALSFTSEFINDVPDFIYSNDPQLKDFLETQSRLWLPSQRLDASTLIMINGRIYNPEKDSIKVYPGPKRLTILSDSHSPVTRIGELPNENVSIINIPMVDGECNDHKVINSPLPLYNTSIFFSLNCIKGKNEMSSNSSVSFVEKPLPIKDESKSSLIPWLIAGAAAILVYSQYNSTKEKRIMIPRGSK